MKRNACLNILLAILFRRWKVENRSTPCWMCLRSSSIASCIPIQWLFPSTKSFCWVYWTSKWPWFGINPPIRWKEMYVLIFCWQDFFENGKWKIDRHLVECVSGLCLLIRRYKLNGCLLLWSVYNGCSERVNYPGLEEIRQLDENKCMFECSAGNTFSKMESGKLIGTLLNMSQVFVYRFMDINWVAVYFCETFLLGVFKMKSVLVWT